MHSKAPSLKALLKEKDPTKRNRIKR